MSERPRHRSRRVLHFAARHQSRFDSCEREDEQDAAAGECRQLRRLDHSEVVRIDGEETAGEQQEERQHFRDRDRAVHARASLDPQDVDRRKHGVDADQHRRRCGARRDCWHERAEICHQHRPHRRHRKRQHHPQQKTREETHERPERDLDIGVEAAGQRDAAPGLGHAQNDQAHHQGTEQVGHECGRAERRRHVGGQPEDAGADGEVDDAGGERERADGAAE